MADIFISYASEDRDKAQQLAHALGEHGWSVWWDRTIAAGRSFADVIDEQLEASRCVVALWSTVSVRKNWVLEEAQDGLDRGVLVPVFTETTRPPRGFRRIHAEDLVGWDGDQQAPAFKKLAADISQLIGPPTGAVVGESEIESVPAEPTAAPDEASTPPVSATNETAPVVTQTYEPLSVFRDKLKDGSKGPEMVVIPAGSFVMGSPDDEPERRDGEGPQHEVAFQAPFAIGKYAVTFDEYDRFCEATDFKLRSDGGWGRDNMPVIYVWKWAVKAYCVWLSDQTGKDYRLPSEAEWEYATRAGTEGPFSFEGPISNAKANYDSTYCHQDSAKELPRKHPVPVGSLPANPWGLHEVHGNVWEIVEDYWHQTYRGAPLNGTAWLGSHGGVGARCTLRGGSWLYRPSSLRSANRTYMIRAADNDVGFRLAQDL